MVNAVTFGVVIHNYPPIGKGSVAIHYDIVEVTVEYSEYTANSSHLENAAETKFLKTPVVYPNPFKTISNMQFVARETGNAVVELYTILGTKTQTLYSGRVIQGQTYNLTIGDRRLAKGMYIYRITNGKQIFAGRILKVE